MRSFGVARFSSGVSYPKIGGKAARFSAERRGA
jgi:hypothetical protein